MLKEKSYFLHLSATFLIALSAISGFSGARIQEPSEPSELDEILRKSAAYCERLSNSVLFFICQEKVQESRKPIYITEAKHRISQRRWRNIQRFQTNNFVYDYQLIGKDGEIQEVRKLIEKNGEKLGPDQSEHDYLRFRHKNIIMGPSALLNAAWQHFNEYKIVKKEQYKGDKVTVLEITPKPDYELGHLYGKAWIKDADGSVFKIEWSQDGIDGYEKLAEMAKEIQMEPRIILSAEYDYEKNGLRFPSKFTLEETYVDGSGRKVTNSITTTEYFNYKFFTVETEVKYRIEESIGYNDSSNYLISTSTVKNLKPL